MQEFWKRGAVEPRADPLINFLGAKPRIAGEARTEGEVREKTGEGSGEGLGEIFWKIKFETIHFGAYLRQTFEINNYNHHNVVGSSRLHVISKKINIKYLMSGICLILVKYKKW